MESVTATVVRTHERSWDRAFKLSPRPQLSVVHCQPEWQPEVPRSSVPPVEHSTFGVHLSS